MPNFTLPRDNNNQIVQALSPSGNASANISTAGAIRFAIPTGSDIVRLASTQSCHVKFGDSGVTATASDFVFPAGAELFSIMGAGFTHVSLLGLSASPSPASVTKMG